VKLHNHGLAFESMSHSLSFFTIRFYEPFRWVYAYSGNTTEITYCLVSYIRYCLALCGYPDQLAANDPPRFLEYFQKACQAVAEGQEAKKLLLGIKEPAEVHEGMRSSFVPSSILLT
jgi:hypothetical protein